MKITATKVKRELEEKYGYAYLLKDNPNKIYYQLISDTLKVVNEILKYQKNISIK